MDRVRTQEHLDATVMVRGFGTAESAYLFGILRRPNESLCECVVLGTHDSKADMRTKRASHVSGNSVRGRPRAIPLKTRSDCGGGEVGVLPGRGPAVVIFGEVNMERWQTNALIT